MKSKVNVGLTLSRNFQNVRLEFSDEEIEYENESELTAKIRKKFDLLRYEIELEFVKLQ